MPFVEVFAPPGSVAPDRRDQIARRLVGEVMVAEGAPDNEFGRSISWLVWHDVVLWVVGGTQVDSQEPARFVVRVTVPGGSLDDARRAELVERVTDVLADGDDDPSRFLTSPASFVLVEEIADGNWGAGGRIVRLSDIVSFVFSGEAGVDDQGQTVATPAG